MEIVGQLKESMKTTYWGTAGMACGFSTAKTHKPPDKVKEGAGNPNNFFGIGREGVWDANGEEMHQLPQRERTLILKGVRRKKPKKGDVEETTSGRESVRARKGRGGLDSFRE